MNQVESWSSRAVDIVYGFLLSTYAMFFSQSSSMINAIMSLQLQFTLIIVPIASLATLRIFFALMIVGVVALTIRLLIRRRGKDSKPFHNSRSNQICTKKQQIVSENSK